MATCGHHQCGYCLRLHCVVFLGAPKHFRLNFRMPDISTAAWAVLTPIWAIRWGLIVGAGATPWLLQHIFMRLKRPVPNQFQVFRQACAFAACLLAVWSFQLAADTYLIESSRFSELEVKHCRRTGSGDSLACEDGSAYQGVAGGASPRGELGRLYLLPNTAVPVYFEP